MCVVDSQSLAIDLFSRIAWCENLTLDRFAFLADRLYFFNVLNVRVRQRDFAGCISHIAFYYTNFLSRLFRVFEQRFDISGYCDCVFGQGMPVRGPDALVELLLRHLGTVCNQPAG